MNEPDLNQTKIAEYMVTVKNGLPRSQVNFAIYMEENILVLGKMGKKMV